MSGSDPEAIAAWLSKARHDLLAITNNIAAAETPWDVVCFHAQQAAEKALKAFLVAHGITPRRTHDCVRLLEGCLAYDAGLAGLREACADLTTHAVASRYPEDVYQPDEIAGLEMTAKAREVVAAIVERLGLDLPKKDQTASLATKEPTVLAIDVSFDDPSLHVHLADGRTISVPLEWFPGLRDATDEQRANWRLIGNGVGIHWEDLDEHVSVARLLEY